MHDSPPASATPSSVTRYGGDTSTPTYTSASFAESIGVHGSGVASPIALATALPSGLPLLNMLDELLLASLLPHDQSSAEATLSTASATMGRPLMIHIGIFLLGNESTAAAAAHASTLGGPCYPGVTVGLREVNALPRGPAPMIFHHMHSPSILCFALVAAVVACSPARSTSAGTTPTPAPAAAPVATDSLPNDVKWVRMSAEYRALTRQAYALAGDRLPELAKGLRGADVGVISRLGRNGARQLGASAPPRGRSRAVRSEGVERMGARAGGHRHRGR